MGLLQCPLSAWGHSNDEEDSDFPTTTSSDNHSSHSNSSNSFLSSEPSLPSVSSLNQPPSAASRYHCVSTFKAHSTSLFSLTISGKHLFSASSNGEIRLWPRDVMKSTPMIQNSTTHRNIIASSKSGVKSLVVSGDKLFSGHQDHKIRVWKIETEKPNMRYKCICTLPKLNDRFMKLFLAKNYVKVRRHKRCTWVNHVDTVSALGLSQDGSLIYSASWDRSFKVWSTSDFKCLESVWNAHDDAINAIAVSHDGFVYTGSADRKIKVWRKNGGDKNHVLMDTLEKHKSAVNALALSTDGSVLYSGACDRSIIVWEKDGGGDGDGERRHMVVVGALRGHSKAILCIGVVGELVYSGSADKTVRVWRRGVGKNYSCLAVLDGHRGPVKCLAAAVESCTDSSSDSTSHLVYSGSLDGDIKVWEVWVPLL